MGASPSDLLAKLGDQPALKAFVTRAFAYLNRGSTIVSASGDGSQARFFHSYVSHLVSYVCSGSRRVKDAHCSVSACACEGVLCKYLLVVCVIVICTGKR